MPSDFATRQKNDVIRDISALGSLINYILLLLILLAAGNIGLFKKLSIGLIFIYIAIILIRTFYFKERPEKLPHKNYIERLDASSFPSLHAARISLIGAVLMEHYNNLYFSILSVLIILAVCYSRIRLKKHDFADIAYGIILGIFVYFSLTLLIGFP